MPSVPPPLWAALPFAAMLLAIALGPIMAAHRWEDNRTKLAVAVVLALPVAALSLGREPAALGHAAAEYVSFMVLLGSLYAIAGGILLDGELPATPRANAALLGVGAVLASLIGTTGASMLLIRPLLRANRARRRTRHTVVFFIFLVSNVGGLLTPLGDPPLFLGYLRGVPFTWTFSLWLPWLFTVAVLLAVYVVWDSVHHAREPRRTSPPAGVGWPALSVRGAPNALALIAVVLAVALLGQPWRECAMAAAAGLSLAFTPRAIRRANHFTAGPMVEVGALFLGIFLTMIPALEWLRAHGPALGVREPWQFFWVGGLLSSLLDNAPTYLTCRPLAQGLGLDEQVVGVTHAVLTGLSLGTVFMGANTYIGNAPNFMVKAIAEESSVPMPGFFGYLAMSTLVLLPVYAAVTWLFL